MEKGTLEINLNNTVYKIQYEASNESSDWFDLMVWLNGRSISDRVPRYTLDLVEDIKSPHAIRLLEELLEQNQNDT